LYDEVPEDKFVVNRKESNQNVVNFMVNENERKYEYQLKFKLILDLVSMHEKPKK